MSQDSNKDDRTNPLDLKTIIKDDIIGVSDFKRSKIGSVTGFSAVSRIASDLKGQASESLGRTGDLIDSLTAHEDLPSLPDGGEPSERFYASMRLHGRTERDLDMIIRNSHRSSWLYISLSVIGAMASAWSILAYPVAGLIDLMARFGPLPLLFALAVKHTYTNWIVRRRRLDGFVKFVLSGEWLPMKTP